MTAIANASSAPILVERPIDRLYRDYGAAVRRWAGHLARSSSDAEDIVQEVFLVAHVRSEELPVLRNPGAWLFRIVENVARHLWRHRRRNPAFSVDRLSDLPDRNPTPLDLLEERRLQATLEQALATLCERDRRLLVLGDPRRTASRSVLVDVNPETVRVWRHRARLRLVRSLRLLERPARGRT